MTFSETLAHFDVRQMRRRVAEASHRQVESALARAQLSMDDLLVLLSPAALPYLEEIAQRAQRLSIQRFGRVITLYAPLYLSNVCSNSCRYCNFNAKQKFPRAILGAAEIRQEALYLRNRGFRHILLVSGEAPQRFPVRRLEEALSALAGEFSSLSIEVQPLTHAEYERMVNAGADGVTLYQETYDREVYAAVHPGGLKRDYDLRLTALERAGEAGIRRLGIGALLGLNDFRSEGIALALHADYLMKRFWRSTVSLSVPRLRHAPVDFNVPSPVGDRELVQLLCALRLAFPDVGLVLSTREPAPLRDALIPLGVTHMSAGSCTTPGGYTQPLQVGAQFEVEDKRSPHEVAEVIRASGYDPVWKDWDRVMHGGQV
jgi:2-iminoacetate synthase